MVEVDRERVVTKTPLRRHPEKDYVLSSMRGDAPK